MCRSGSSPSGGCGCRRGDLRRRGWGRPRSRREANCSGDLQMRGRRWWRWPGTGDRRRVAARGRSRRGGCRSRRRCAGDGAVADGAVGVGGEGHVAAKAGVAAEEDAAGFAERGRCAIRRRGRWGSGRAWRRGRGCLRRSRVPVSETLVSVRAGWAVRRTCHCCGSGSQRAKSASVREKGIFSWPSLRLTRAPVASM